MATTNSNRQRAYSAAHFVLELDQQHKAGFFRSVEGGGVKADIMSYRSSSEKALFRRVGKPKYEDLKIQVGMSMSQVFYTWIEGFFSGDGTRRNGAILAGDFHFKERARREFYDALISEVSIPKLDATDRNACYMGVTMVPESIRFAPGSGADLSAQDGSTEQKLWTPNNFEFSIDSLADACRRVTRVDGFTIKQEVHEYHAGNLRDCMRVAGMLEFPNLSFYVPEADAKPFIDHFTKYVINGEPPPSTRMTGEIAFLDHTGSQLCRIDLQGIDIASVSPDKSDSTSQEIKQVRVEIACESMSFRYLGGQPAQGQA